MKGDFSNLYFDPSDNFNGVLDQQGRVRLDRDGLAQTQITTHWQDTAGADTIGPRVMAIPSSDVNAFKVTEASLSDGQLLLTLLPGHGWADGLLVHLNGDESVTRVATYLESPIQSPGATVDSIAENVRDAVVLEVWREAINGFQIPSTLIEPALGGPDTTERLHTAMALRLFRLNRGQNCQNIGQLLQDNFDSLGKLTVSLQPTEVIAGDCPVVAGGGYTGFEHLLYRVEIAQVDSGIPSFKWSQFNGGLVGRGLFNAADQTVLITANLQAIATSGLDQFYLEAVEYDPLSPATPGLGHWRVTYGTQATLNGDSLELAAAPRFGTIPGGSSPVFFRLWNGIGAIADFLPPAPGGDPTELLDGIRLEFEAPAAANYRPGDYWTFPVRAGEIGNPETLIDAQPPMGIRYHRVPLAVLTWNAEQTLSFDSDDIEDCREVFNPLTNQRVCCTVTVGDGRATHGDVDTIEAALRHLPARGGEICLLPGLHETNARIENRRNIKIKGCDKQTRVVPRDREAPIFQVVDSECIALLHMDLVTLGGTAIALRGSEDGTLKDIEIGHNRFIACQQAIHVQRGSGIHIHHNLIRMLDKASAGVAIYLHADDSRIERNDLGVIPTLRLPPIDPPDGEEVPDPTDPCAQLEVIYTNIPFFTAYIAQIWAVSLLFLPTNPYRALGGIQVAGGSERVAILDNKINGGAGNGIALGTSLADFLAGLEPDPDDTVPTIDHRERQIWGGVSLDGAALANISLQFEPSDGTRLTAVSGSAGDFLITASPGTYEVSVLSPGYAIAAITPQSRQEFGTFYQIELERSQLDLGDLVAFIYDLSIRQNTISNMGLSGIGLPTVELPDLASNNRGRDRLLGFYAQILRVFGNPILGLDITENHISQCFQNPLTQALRDLIGQRGLGGISLGLCADVAIHRNRIEKNGVVYTKPTCGVWISYGEEVAITDNAIADNAPLADNADLQPGQRAGIALIASSLSILNFLLGEKRDRAALVTHRPAARIQDNSVDQPAGRALTLLAFGPATLLNNQFNSELAGLTPLERAVGTLLVLNLGGLNQAGSFIGSGAATNAAGLSSLSNRQPSFQRDSIFRLPNGHTLFNSNQTRQGLDHQSLIAQMLWTADDLGFDGNQAEALPPGLPLSDTISALINTALLGATLRASDNRLKEPLRSSKTSLQFSLLTLTTLMNTTTMNQGSHCIVASNLTPGRDAIAKGNQVLDESFCPRFNETQDFDDANNG
ncbi:DUF6519 domain-containing protein [Nodosilinea nodulosa]|uniref:DUF6519 domain-containing protein n=1 Tax=Nodosilinea nodulosa TaxID=416001 RepID=UPI0003146DFE|nr:DUF6519 domain-containing protein [Nodosilinea nodulosa]